MKPPFRLVSRAVSHDTVRALESMLEAARGGELIGMAYAAMFRERKYLVNATGEAYRNPTFSRGMLRDLDDELGRLNRSLH